MSAVNQLAQESIGVGVGLCVGAIGGASVVPAIGAALTLGGVGAFIHGQAKKKGPDCERRLRDLASQFKQELLRRNPAYETEFEDACTQLSALLPHICPTPEAFAELALGEGAARGSSVATILRRLEERGYPLSASKPYQVLAQDVIELMLELPYADAEYFQEQFAPYLQRQIAHGVGRANRRLDDISAQVAELLTRVASADTAALGAAHAELDRLRSRDDMREKVLRVFLEAVGEQDLPPEELTDELAKFAARYNEMLDRLGGATDLPATIQSAALQVHAALEAGDVTGADRSWARLDEDYRRWLHDQSKVQDQTRRERARILRERAELALIKLDHRAAAAFYGECADTLPSEDVAERREAYMDQANALSERCHAFLDTAAGRQAIHIVEHCALPLIRREDDPEAWAIIQNNLGAAHMHLGWRGSRADLQAAEQAFRAALQARPRHVDENNLAATLVQLGEQGDLDALQRAVALSQEVLAAPDRDPTSPEWAETQNILGNALQSLWERGDVEALPAAIIAYRAALAALPAEYDATRRATKMSDLADALMAKGLRGDRDALHEASELMNAAAAMVSRKKEPATWATLQNNLGKSNYYLAQAGTPKAIGAAVSDYERALEVLTFEDAPSQWLSTKLSLGHALELRGDIEGDPSYWRRAEACYRVVANLSPGVPVNFLASVEDNLRDIAAKLER